MEITWHVPNCAWCGVGIHPDDHSFVQVFGDEGDYYFHQECQEELVNRAMTPDERGQA